jgi:DnaJ-class molecular chaperone
MKTKSSNEPFEGECGSTELIQTTRMNCESCQGSGMAAGAPCETCGGSGVKTVQTKVSAARCLPEAEKGT